MTTVHYLNSARLNVDGVSLNDVAGALTRLNNLNEKALNEYKDARDGRRTAPSTAGAVLQKLDMTIHREVIHYPNRVVNQQPESATAFAGVLGTMTSLKTLTMNYIPPTPPYIDGGISNEAVRLLGRAIGNMEDLERLQLAWGRGEIKANYLRDLDLKNLKKLSALDLKLDVGKWYPDAVTKALPKLLERTKGRLMELKLFVSGMFESHGNNGMLNLFKAIKSMPLLQTLHLNLNFCFNAIDAKAFRALLPELKNLRDLKLSLNSGHNEMMMVEIADALEQLHERQKQLHERQADSAQLRVKVILPHLKDGNAAEKLRKLAGTSNWVIIGLPEK